MKHLLLAIVVLSLPASVFAEECLTKTESYEGKSVSVETCVARVDDVVKTTADGYMLVNYIVQYKGQRLVVSDPLAQSDHAVGDQISFMVARLDTFRTLYAVVYEPKPAGEECPP